MSRRARRLAKISRFSRRIRWSAASLLCVAAAASLPGCGELPAGAPTALEIMNSPNTTNGIYVFDLDKKVIDALASVRQDTFVGRFANAAPAADLRIAVGDTLQIQVIEQGPGLFGQSSDATSGAGSTGLSAARLLPITVGRNGSINVPFAGELHAAGLTVDELRAQIERKLTDKAVNPQVQVSLADGPSVGANSATVGGEVNHAGIIALRPSGSRLLDVIAEAGGARFPGYEITVHVTRAKREAAVSLQRIVDRPEENIFIYPGDSIYVSRDPRTFTVLGATNKVGHYNFGSVTSNLAEAVAEAGGFVDSTSDPAGVFLFRYEPPELVRALSPTHDAGTTDPVPVIYRLNLRDSDGYFRARQFAMRDKDMILLANADGAQLLKFLNLMSVATGNASLINQMVQSGTNGGGTIATVVTTSPAAP
jgi:polysaccharide export outer membrane protein